MDESGEEEEEDEELERRKIEEQGLYIGKRTKRKERKPEIANRLQEIVSVPPVGFNRPVEDVPILRTFLFHLILPV